MASVLLLDKLTNSIGSFLGTNTGQPGPKAGGFSIEEFRSALHAHDSILPTNLFLVSVYGSGAASSSALDSRVFSSFAMATELPGLSLAVDENIRLGIGPIERFPHAAVFDDLTLTFLGDGKGYIMSRLQHWINNIVEFKNPGAGPISTSYHKVSYKDDYSSTIEIVVYNTTSDKIMVYRFYEAYPYRLSPVEMSWANQNDIMMIASRFHFTNWDFLLQDPVEGNVQGLTLMQKLQKAGTIYQVVSSLKNPQSIGDAINLVNNANIVGSNMNGFFGPGGRR